MRSRKAVVTGGAGFIGSQLVGDLIKHGWEVTVIDDLSVGRKENVHHSAQFIQGDILDAHLLKLALTDADVVFHLAAKVSIRSSTENFVTDAEFNIMGTIRVIEALVHHRIKKLIFASSMAVYGETSQLPTPETHPLKPCSPYGISKLTGEQYCLYLSQAYQFQAVCLRFFNTYGKGQAVSPYVGVITHFADTLNRKQTPVIFGDGEQIRDFIHVRDVSRACIAALDYNGPSDVFNVGTGEGTTINQLAELLNRIYRIDKNYRHEPQRAGEPRHSLADTKKAKEILKFQHQDSLENVLAVTLGKVII